MLPLHGSLGLLLTLALAPTATSFTTPSSLQLPRSSTPSIRLGLVGADACLHSTSKWKTSNRIHPKSHLLFLQRKNDNAPKPKLAAWRAKWKQLLTSFHAQFTTCKRKIKIGLVALLLFWTVLSPDAFAKGTMGRSGGSFRSSPRLSAPSPSRVYSPPRSYHRPSTTLYYRNPVPRTTVVVGPQYQPYGPSIRPFFRPSDLILVTGTGLAIAYGVKNQLDQDKRDRSSALGPGYTVSKITVSLSVPNRDAPNSILRKLQRMASTANTSTRRGVQDLVSAVALELLRQEDSFRSAASFSEQYKQEGETERAYFRQSINERSKYEDEREYKSGSKQSSSTASQQDPNATEAVVTILVAMEGDSTRLPAIRSRQDVREALNRIAVDAQVEDCLLSGEVSWAPELREETLTPDDIYVDYPNLCPL